MRFSYSISIFLLFSACFLIQVDFALGCTYEDPDLQEQQSKCTQDPSKVWSCEKNRCINTEHAQEKRDEYLACAKIENETERKACHDNLAKNDVGDTSVTPTNGKAATMTTAFAAAAAAINMFGSRASATCMAQTIFKFTALGGLVGHLGIELLTKNKLKKVQEKYQEEQANSNPFDAQVRAFEFLKEEQKTIADVAGKKKLIYGISAAGFAGAAAMSIFGYQSCSGGGDSSGDSGSGGNTDDQPDTETGGLNMSQISSMFSHPIAIIALSGIAAYFNMQAMNSASQTQKDAKENVKRIDEMLAEFKASLASFCTEGRDDLRNPDCYCYNADGTKNSGRSKSETCQKVWSDREKSLFAEAGSYEDKGENQKPQYCVRQDQQVDKECNCQKFVDRDTGKNTCLDATLAFGAAGAAGVPFEFGTLQKAITELNNGNLEQANLTAGDIGNLALRNTSRAGELIKKLNLERKAKGEELVDTSADLAGKMAKSLATPALLRQVASANPAALFSKVRESLPSGLLKNNLDSTQAKANLNIGDGNKNAFLTGDNRNIDQPTKAKKKSFSFGTDSNGSSSGKVQTFNDEPNNRYKYKDSEISQSSDQSIWKIISNRYTQSALKRLFYEEGEL